MSTLRVARAERPLAGSVPVPCDPWIARRLLLFAALSRGPCVLSGAGIDTATAPLAGALRELGVRIESAPRRLQVAGVSLSGLSPPSAALDVGRCGDTLALVLGLLSGQRFAAAVHAHAELDTPLLAELLLLLGRRGAALEAPRREGDRLVLPSRGLPPEGRLDSAEWAHAGSLPLKSALLVSGLFARAPTSLSEALISPDHTERALDALDLPVPTLGSSLELHPPADAAAIRAFDAELPGDVTAAALLLSAAALVSGSRITLRGVGLNPSRTGGLDLLRQLGGSMLLTPGGAVLGEPVGELAFSATSLRGASVGGELWARMQFDPLLPLGLAMACHGTLTLCDLALAEPKRTALLVETARRFGLRIAADHETMQIAGAPGSALTPSCIRSHGEPGVVMLASLLGLVAAGESLIEDADCVSDAFPRFVGTLRALGAPLGALP